MRYDGEKPNVTQWDLHRATWIVLLARGKQGCGGGVRLLKSLVLRAWESRNPRHPSTHLNEFAMIVKRREE